MIINLIVKIGEITVTYLSNEKLPEVMQYISMAQLTIMIPFGVALLDKEKSEVLDRYVFLDRIINAKYFLWNIFGLILPFLLWNHIVNILNNTLLKNEILLVLFCYWVYSIFFLIRTLIDMYGWLKRKELNKYLEYLKLLKNSSDAIVVWGEIWKKRNENLSIENQYFEIFSNKIDGLFIKNDIINIKRLLRIFYQFIEKRNTYFLGADPKIFPKILQWHHRAWMLEYDLLTQVDKAKKDDNLYGQYNDLFRLLNETISKIEERALMDGDAYGFFDNLKRHVNEYQGNYKENEFHKYYYVEYLSIQKIFFNNINESKEYFSIKEHHFPIEWKISIDTIKENTLISILWRKEFLDWARDRIDNYQGDHDYHFDKVVDVLFPDIHTIYFPYILFFVFRSWINDRRMESIINDPPNFGGYYHYEVMDVSGKSEEEIKREREREWEESKAYTCKLAVSLFRGSFSNIKEYIHELESLETRYVKDVKKEQTRKILVEIFQSIDNEITSATARNAATNKK